MLALAACAGGERPLDLDLRGLGDGFTTSEAAQAAPGRPAPDARGVIATGSGQVAVAREGDTVASLAARLGLSAAALAAFNGLSPDAQLRRDEVVALPGGAAAPPGAVAAATPGAVTTTALSPAAPIVARPSPSGPPAGVDPARHQVARGETAYSIARLYGVPVSTVADWNGLGPDLAVREGQFLLVPPGAPAAVPAEPETPEPGQGSATPVPPSASEPLPEEAPATVAEAEEEPAAAAPQEMAAEQTAPADSGRLAQPVAGPIIRAYAPGRNEGVDIGAAAGTAVRAAEAGTVAAVTTNTEGVNIVVIKHADDLLTVYTHLGDLQVAKDDVVSRGETIGAVREGDPSFLHFEVRRGMQSTDPAEFLP